MEQFEKQFINKKSEYQEPVTEVVEFSIENGGKEINKLINGEVMEITRYDKDGKLLAFLDKKSFDKIKEKFLKIQILGERSKNMHVHPNDLLESINLKAYPPLRKRVLEILKFQGFMEDK